MRNVSNGEEVQNVHAYSRY